jgi:hypothetical protein
MTLSTKENRCNKNASRQPYVPLEWKLPLYTVYTLKAQKFIANKRTLLPNFPCESKGY